jgi:glycosyltransferase involved in cell wall biosynthesis
MNNGSTPAVAAGEGKSLRIVVTVISDLVTDQRVHKVCRTLSDHGYQVLLIGARRKGSLPLAARTYPAKRIGMLFQKRWLFYAEFNLSLFFKLLFVRADILLGNDLDAMPATWLAARLKGKPVIYDTHEYWLGMPELNGRPRIRRVWKAIESFIFPRVESVYTICDSFCELYKRDYGRELRAVRNVPYLVAEKAVDGGEGGDTGEGGDAGEVFRFAPEIEEKLAGKHFLLFQGAGINPERGVEELVMAMQRLDPARFHLLIIGGGDLFEEIRKMVREGGLEDRITILPKVPFNVLRSITRRAHLGLSLDKPTNINHIYGLPNKIFDYLHSGVPVLVSRLVELEKIVLEYQVGTFIENHEPDHIATCIREIFVEEGRDGESGAGREGDGQGGAQAGGGTNRLERWKKNTERVRQELNWEKESCIVLEIFKQVEHQKS